MSRIADTNVWVGPYVGSQNDMANLKNNRITGILNLMTENQMKERGINW